MSLFFKVSYLLKSLDQKFDDGRGRMHIEKKFLVFFVYIEARISKTSPKAKAKSEKLKVYTTCNIAEIFTPSNSGILHEWFGPNISFSIRQCIIGN